MLKRNYEDLTQPSIDETSPSNQESQLTVYEAPDLSDCEYSGVALENERIHYHVPSELSGHYLGIMLLLKVPLVEQMIYMHFASGMIKPHLNLPLLDTNTSNSITANFCSYFGLQLFGLNKNNIQQYQSITNIIKHVCLSQPTFISLVVRMNKDMLANTFFSRVPSVRLIDRAGVSLEQHMTHVKSPRITHAYHSRKQQLEVFAKPQGLIIGCGLGHFKYADQHELAHTEVHPAEHFDTIDINKEMHPTFVGNFADVLSDVRFLQEHSEQYQLIVFEGFDPGLVKVHNHRNMVFSNLCRILNPNGMLVVCVPEQELGSLLAIAKEAGFDFAAEFPKATLIGNLESKLLLKRTSPEFVPAPWMEKTLQDSLAKLFLMLDRHNLGFDLSKVLPTEFKFAENKQESNFKLQGYGQELKVKLSTIVSECGFCAHSGHDNDSQDSDSEASNPQSSAAASSKLSL